MLSLYETNIQNFKPYYLHFEYFQYFIEIIDLSSYYINLREIFYKEISLIKENVFDRIQNLSEKDIKEIDKFTIEKIARHLKNIVDPEDKTLLFDELNLNFHLKCLTSNSLPKRIKGITEINNIIQKVDNRDLNTPLSNTE